MAREKLVFVSKGCGITHWQSLLPGLVIIEVGLADSIQAQLEKSVEERQAIAREANRVAVKWNNDVMYRWSHIIRETIAGYGESSG